MGQANTNINQQTQEEPGYHELEVCQHESDLQQRWNDCKKNQGHREFIPVDKFNIRHLPRGHRDQLYLDYIMALISLTVRLVVRYVSCSRPEYIYPFYQYRGKHFRAFGSGRVLGVDRKFTDMDGKRCPCTQCRKLNHEDRKKQWGKFGVITVKHVVLNDKESRHTQVDVDYNTDTDRDTCSELHGVGVGYSDIKVGEFRGQQDGRHKGKGDRSIIACWYLFVFILLQPLQVASCLTCPSGTYLRNTPATCVPCPHNSFMPYVDHQEEWCKTCENIKDPELEILVSPCNNTHDAIIHCVQGYYRDLARNPRETGTCQKCSKCSEYRMHTGQICSTYRNTICCMDENFDVVPNHHGVPLCRERPWFCRQGQYFDTTGFQCLPCPNNTFMPEDFHVHPACFRCREYAESNRPVNSVIAQLCNSTHDTVVTCQDGFFIKYTMGYRSDDIGCSPCTDCSTTDDRYEGRKCSSMKDTVCCPQPNMTVDDTLDGPVCTGPSPSCAKGMCKQHNTRKRSVRCMPCDDDKEGENETGEKLDDNDDDSQRQVTSDDHPGESGNVSYKTCNAYDWSGFIVVAVLFTLLLSVNIAFLILYRCKKWKLYFSVPGY